LLDHIHAVTSASAAQVVAAPVVTLRPTMLQSAAGAALEFAPNPEAPGSKTTWSPGAVETLYVSNCLILIVQSHAPNPGSRWVAHDPHKSMADESRLAIATE
jgi:hypothetical protein